MVLNGSYSEFSLIESGVPQGSVLGPLLFLIYINDLEKNIKSNVRFFADDTMLFSIVNDPSTSAADLNHDLDLISQWAYQWKMEFNPDPSKQVNEVLFSQKTSSPDHPPLMFNGVPVTEKDDQNHLGLILDPKLSFSKHLHEKMTKAKKIIGIIKYLSKYLPIKTLNQMYKALVRLHLDYCGIIYHEPAVINQAPLGLSLTTLMEKVERIQHQAALAVTDTWQGSSRSKLYDELGWETLSDRRKCHRILLIHKIINDETPSYLKSKLPAQRRRQPNTVAPIFQTIFPKTNRYKNSFFPDATSSWNVCISYFSEMPHFSSLKNHLFSLFRPKSRSIFSIHDPRGIHYLFQLRVGLSPLREHKKRYNFADTPCDKCLCNIGVENTNHFLFQCPFYVTQRATLAASVILILLRNNLNHLGNQERLYLYGHESMSDDDNKAILLATIRYIKDTNRFSA